MDEAFHSDLVWRGGSGNLVAPANYARLRRIFRLGRRGTEAKPGEGEISAWRSIYFSFAAHTAGLTASPMTYDPPVN